MRKWNYSDDQDENKYGTTDIKIDPSFRKLTKNAVCFHIWKVENDRIEAIPKSQYGVFYNDCTYIIYAACVAGTYISHDTITRELKNTSNLERFIHFWLGSDTTPQKSGNVAYKVMELDTHFGNAATLYRETEENESTRFLSYFKKGVIILSGELSKINPSARLFQVKGKKCPTCTEQKIVCWENFSSEFVMILQTPKYVFVWVGRSSSPSERRNALSIASKMQEEQNIPELTIVDDGYEQSMNEARKKEWNQYLSLKTRFVHHDCHTEKYLPPSLKLYKCGYHTGKYRIEEVKGSAPEQFDLNDSESAFIIDGVSFGVWVWVGKLAASQEKVEAMRNARGFVKKKKYPSSTPVIRVIEGHEPLEFTRLFRTWQTNNTCNKLAKVLGKLDSLTLLQRPKMAAETQLIDDGSGEKHLFRITEFQYVELPRQKKIAFFSGDCYLIHYCIPFADPGVKNSSDSGSKYILYFWCGKETRDDVKAKCEILASDYFENLGKHSVMVKLTEGFETSHFLQIFNGKFMIFSGRSMDLDPTGLNSVLPSSFVLRVFGDSSYNSKAKQVDPNITLSSRHCFVIRSYHTWVWCGQSSTGDAREIAKGIGLLLGEYTLAVESKESDDFWRTISEHFKFRKPNELTDNLPHDERLNNIDNSRAGLYISFLRRGNLVLKEVLAFEQADLTPEDIYLLDVGNMIFIWIGALSPKNEQSMCWNMAKNFLRNFPVPRNECTAMSLVRQGYEPNIFMGFFDSWNDKLWNGHIKFEAMRGSIETIISPVTTSIYAVNGETDFDKYQKYPLSVLQQEADLLPVGVNPTKKEIHLTHDDFVDIFKMKFTEFDSLPCWKKQELKKKYKLF